MDKTQWSTLCTAIVFAWTVSGKAEMVEALMTEGLLAEIGNGMIFRQPSCCLNSLCPRDRIAGQIPGVCTPS